MFFLILTNFQIKLIPLLLGKFHRSSLIKEGGGYSNFVEKIINIDELLMDVERSIIPLFDEDFFEEHLLTRSILSLGIIEYLLSHFDENFRIKKIKDGIASSIAEDYFPNKSNYPSTQVKAIYLGGNSLRSKRLMQHVRYIKKNKMNTIVFDVKDVTGYVNVSIVDSMVKKVQNRISPVVREPKKMIQHLRKRKIHTIARIALFQDETLARVHPELAIYAQNGQPLLVKGKRVWVDPARKKVQEYNLRLIWETIRLGVDEIQLDYVRYPAEGIWRKGKYYNLKSHSDKPNIITKFLQNVYSLTSSYGILLSIDVFGVVAWGEKIDIKSTGQNLKLLSQAVDVVSPMVYPSHYGDIFYDIKDPSNSPYRIVKMSCRRLKKLLEGSAVSIRPWLQAFPWRVKMYDSKYIEEQIKAAGAGGYMLWNAKNRYISYNHPNKNLVERNIK